MSNEEKSDSSELARFTDATGEVFEESVSVMYRGAYQKALNAECSPREAIKAFCLHCVGYARVDVTNCTAPRCPLFQFRPYQP